MNSWQTLETTMRLDRQIRLARAREASGRTMPEEGNPPRFGEQLRALRATVAGAGAGPATSACDECCPLAAPTAG